jgi:hypothetical protein
MIIPINDTLRIVIDGDLRPEAEVFQHRRGDPDDMVWSNSPDSPMLVIYALCRYIVMHHLEDALFGTAKGKAP